MDLKNIYIRNNLWWDVVFLAFLLVVQTFYVMALASLESPLVQLSRMLSHHHTYSKDLHWVIVHMSHSLSIPQVVALTGLKQQKIKWLLANYWHTGHVIEQPKHHRGGKAILGPDDTGVCLSHLLEIIC